MHAGLAKRQRVAAEDLSAGISVAVVTTVWGIPQGLGSLGYKLRFEVICDAHRVVWGWSVGPLMHHKRLVWVASKQPVSKAFRSTSGDDVKWHEGEVSIASVFRFCWRRIGTFVLEQGMS